MPHINGNFYHRTSQGYAAEKNKMSQKAGAEVKAKPDAKGDSGGKGEIVHVKHHGGGKFSVKHEGGEVSKHDSKQEMLSHLDQHYPEDQNQNEEQGMDEGEAGNESEALKSILG